MTHGRRLTEDDTVIAVNVSLQPMKCVDGKWRWLIVNYGFGCDAYLDGMPCELTSTGVADTCEGLLWYDEETVERECDTALIMSRSRNTLYTCPKCKNDDPTLLSFTQDECLCENCGNIERNEDVK